MATISLKKKVGCNTFSGSSLPSSHHLQSKAVRANMPRPHQDNHRLLVHEQGSDPHVHLEFLILVWTALKQEGQAGWTTSGPTHSSSTQCPTHLIDKINEV